MLKNIRIVITEFCKAKFGDKGNDKYYYTGSMQDAQKERNKAISQIIEYKIKYTEHEK